MAFKTISKFDIEKAIRAIHYLSASQKEYIKGVLFEHGDYGGMTKFEFEKSLRKLKQDHSDKINRFELGKVEEALMALLEDDNDLEEAA